MKYIVCLLFAVVLFCSSSNKFDKEDLKLEILNTEFFSRANISNKDARNVIRFDNYIYDSVPVNKINIKITNSGTKKYVLFLKKELDEIEDSDSDNIKLIIYKNNDIFQPTNLKFLVQATMKGFSVRKEMNIIESDSIKKELNEKYLKEKIDMKKIKFQREMNYIVIHPGESKFFSYYQTLPIFEESMHQFYIYDFKSNENYTCQLSFKNDAQGLRKNITINQLKEIEENGYTVFDGIIRSNKVPVKMISLP
ncbi:hypothetical protein [Flavobacterium sp.]|uniref:hypothetical protein n=1 Tax=Flavobacterium sp. TaxID=239 RepID=UPI0039E528DD